MILDDEVLVNVAMVFLKIPFQYSMGLQIGKEYLASKDFLLMYGFELKQWLEVILSMGIIWCANKNK